MSEVGNTQLGEQGRLQTMLADPSEHPLATPTVAPIPTPPRGSRGKKSNWVLPVALLSAALLTAGGAGFVLWMMGYEVEFHGLEDEAEAGPTAAPRPVTPAPVAAPPPVAPPAAAPPPGANPAAPPRANPAAPPRGNPAAPPGAYPAAPPRGNPAAPPGANPAAPPGANSPPAQPGPFGGRP